MGLYSNNRTSLNGVEIPALEGYNGNVGIATAMLEAAQDDLKFFDMIIARDFQEAEMNAAGYTNESEEMTAVNEGALQNAWGKIVEFVKKLIAKIKSIFSSATAKINGVVIRDNKKLVEKYKKAVLSKNLKDMKYKWAKSTGKEINLDGVDNLFTKYISDIESSKSVEAVNTWIEKNEDDVVVKLYGAALGTSEVEAGDFAKEAHEHMYDEVEELDEGADSKKTEVMSYLVTCKKSLTELEKDQRETEKTLNKLVSDASKRASEAGKKIPDKDGSVSDADKVELAKANAVYRLVVKYQSVVLACVREGINAVKFEIAQNRAFFTKAAAYNPKAKNESADLFDAIDEAVEFDVHTAFADYAVAE